MNGLKHKKQQKNDHLGKWKAKKKVGLCLSIINSQLYISKIEYYVVTRNPM